MKDVRTAERTVAELTKENEALRGSLEEFGKKRARHALRDAKAKAKA